MHATVLPTYMVLRGSWTLLPWEFLFTIQGLGPSGTLHRELGFQVFEEISPSLFTGSLKRAGREVIEPLEAPGACSRANRWCCSWVGGWSQYLELGGLLLLTQVFLWLLKTSEEREVVFLLLLIQIY